MEDFEELLRIQRSMAGRIIQESDTDRKLQMMDIINVLVTQRNKRIQVEQIIVEANHNGFSEEEALRVIDELLDLGFLKQSEQGFIQRG